VSNYIIVVDDITVLAFVAVILWLAATISTIVVGEGVWVLLLEVMNHFSIPRQAVLKILFLVIV
jgi:hypothetical protein